MEMNMNTNTAQRATNRKIEWLQVMPQLPAGEHYWKGNRPSHYWVMNVDGRDIARLRLQCNGRWIVRLFNRNEIWWPPKGGSLWPDDDELMRECEMAVEELLGVFGE
jgi:hypothetical protein